MTDETTSGGHDGFVGVDHLLEVHRAVGHEGERRAGVIVAVQLQRLFAAQGGVHRRGGEDAAGEVAAHRDELDDRLAKVPADLQKVLMLKDFVGRQVVRAPAEVGGGGGLDARARGAGDGRHVDGVLQLAGGREGQQRELDGRGEAAGVGDLARRADLVPLPLRQAVDVAVGFVAVVLRQVHDLQGRGTGVLLPEFPALAVGGAEEEHVDGGEVPAVAETQLRVAEQAAVHLIQVIAGVARRVHEGDLHLRMVHQDAEELARRVAGAAEDANLNHCR